MEIDLAKDESHEQISEFLQTNQPSETTRAYLNGVCIDHIISALA